MSDYTNRIVGLEYVHASDLVSHPGNWRDHPKLQVEALLGVLSEVGITDALLAYRSERNNGRLTVIDGHLRKDAARQTWPVLVLDVDDAEADYILATHDPLAAMAQADAAALDALLDAVNTDEASVQEMLAKLAEDAGLFIPAFSPKAANREVTDDDIDRWRDRLDNKFSDKNDDQVPVICPYCGEEFFINKKNLV